TATCAERGVQAGRLPSSRVFLRGLYPGRLRRDTAMRWRTVMGDFVRVTAEAGIATIRLERPPVNALNGQMQNEIGAVAAQASADPEVRAVILYGGEKTFAAGADVK